jgi:hypothetical protein
LPERFPQSVAGFFVFARGVQRLDDGDTERDLGPACAAELGQKGQALSDYRDSFLQAALALQCPHQCACAHEGIGRDRVGEQLERSARFGFRLHRLAARNAHG